MSQQMTIPTKWHVPPAKTQTSLGIHPVWSVFAVRMWKAWVLSYPLSAHTQADLSLCCAHTPFCWLCHVLAQIYQYSKHFISKFLPYLFLWLCFARYLVERKTVFTLIRALDLGLQCFHTPFCQKSWCMRILDNNHMREITTTCAPN